MIHGKMVAANALPWGILLIELCLMVEQGLTQDAADFAADQILPVAEEKNDREEGS